jgi:hypothetical protein
MKTLGLCSLAFSEDATDPLRAQLGEKRAAKRRSSPPPEKPPVARPPLVTQGGRSAVMPTGLTGITPDQVLRELAWELRGRSRWVRL